MKIISEKSLKIIEDRYALRSRETGEYTKDQKDPFTKWIIRMLLGADNSQNELNKQVIPITVASELAVTNIYSGLFHIINKKIANGVGKAVIPDDIGKYKYFRDNTKDLVTCGITGYEILIDESGKQSIGYVPASQLVIEDVPTRYVYMEKEVPQKASEIYLFVKKYYNNYNTNKLYKLDQNSRMNGQEVDLSEMTTFSSVENFANGTSIVYIECQPMYKVIESLVFTFERNLVAIQAQFYKYLESWLVMKGIKFSSNDKNPDGSVKMTAIKNKIVQTSDASASIEYVSLDNPALGQLIEFTKIDLIRQISAVTSIPTFFFGLEETGGVYGENASFLRLQDFVTECKDYQDLQSEAFDELFEILGIEGSIIWGDVIREQNKAVLDEMKVASSLGLTTKKKMLMEYWELDEEDAIALQAEIDAEQAIEQENSIKLAQATAPAPKF